MSDLVGKLFSSFMIVIAFFLVPAILLGCAFEIYAAARVSNAGREFVDSCRAKKAITADNLNEFNKEVYLFGATDVEINYSRMLGYTSEDGGYFRDEVALSNDDVMDAVYDNGQLNLKNGDSIHLSVRIKHSGSLIGAFSYIGNGNSIAILNDYGGSVY